MGINFFSFNPKRTSRDIETELRKMRARALKEGGVDLDSLPQPLKDVDDKRVVKVYVEGYDDVAFWRGIFDNFSNPYLRFDISVPPQKDLPKGKKVLLSMASMASEDLLLCMDSDFDFLLGDETVESRLINSCPFIFHTYAYATENYLCYSKSLHDVCVKATKNDTRIFDFKVFMAEYSQTIFPAFLWYAYSASKQRPTVFALSDFRSAVRIGYVEMKDNGRDTLKWLSRHVESRVRSLENQYPEYAAALPEFEKKLRDKGVTEKNVYLYMQGHTLFDNVVLPVLGDVCEKLRQMSLARIIASSKEGLALENELRNYNNSLRPVREVLLDNENYRQCHLYKQLKEDIQTYINRTIACMVEKDPIGSAFLRRGSW